MRRRIAHGPAIEDLRVAATAVGSGPMPRLFPVSMLCVAVLVVLAGAPREAAGLVAFERGEVVIDTAGGPVRLSVELARTQEQRAQGLMFRERVAADAGMLFLYERDGEIGMWMRNTLIPLDMLFLARDGRIINIVERTVPLSTTAISSAGPARAVLEVNGGTVQRLGIQPGDRVRFPELEGGP